MQFIAKISKDTTYTADTIFDTLDKDHSGAISLKEFSNGVLVNKNIIKYLDLSYVLKEAISHVGAVSSPKMGSEKK